MSPQDIEFLWNAALLVGIPTAIGAAAAFSPLGDILTLNPPMEPRKRRAPKADVPPPPTP